MMTMNPNREGRKKGREKEMMTTRIQLTRYAHSQGPGEMAVGLPAPYDARTHLWLVLTLSAARFV